MYGRPLRRSPNGRQTRARMSGLSLSMQFRVFASPNIFPRFFRTFSESRTFVCAQPDSTHRNLALGGSEEHPRPLPLSLSPSRRRSAVFAVGLIDVMHESLEAPLLALRASSYGARSDGSAFILETPFGRSLISRLSQRNLTQPRSLTYFSPNPVFPLRL